MELKKQFILEINKRFKEELISVETVKNFTSQFENMKQYKERIRKEKNSSAFASISTKGGLVNIE